MRWFRTMTLLMALLMSVAAKAQLYTGMTGLLHTPSAEMNEAGDARIGCYYMNKRFTPDEGFIYDGEKYNTMDFYLSLTPFSWVEMSYVFTLQKSLINGYDKAKYNQKDRYFSVKLRPLRESRYLPAIAIGANDFMGSPTRWESQGSKAGGYFCKYYVAATKHFEVVGSSVGINVAYRHCPKVYNKKWEGMVGGLTWQPLAMPNIRGIVEYTGNEINIGADALLWKHLLLQVTLQEGRYFSGGVCFQTNLF